MTLSHFTQALAANVVLGVGAAVVVFGAEKLPATLGGVTAGIVLYVWFRVRRWQWNAREEQ